MYSGDTRVNVAGEPIEGSGSITDPKDDSTVLHRLVGSQSVIAEQWHPHSRESWWRGCMKVGVLMWVYEVKV